jgi:Bacterial SH3 domain
LIAHSAAFAKTWEARANLAENHQPAPKGSLFASQKTVAAGFVFAAVTLCLLMWLAINVSQQSQIQCSQAGLIALVFGFGSALSSSFLGGYAAATGPVTIPYFGSSPIKVALGGGILALVVTTIMAWVVVGMNCTKVPDSVARLLAECKGSRPPLIHLGCVQIKILGGTGYDQTLNVRAGPGLFCDVKDLLKNNDIAEVLATDRQWNYVKALTGERAEAEGWVSTSFLTGTPCPGSTP